MNGYAKDKKFDFAYVLFIVLSITFYMIFSILANKTTKILGIQMDVASLAFPLLFVISDIVSEVYGYKYSRILSFLSGVCGLIMFISFSLAISIPEVANNDMNEAFSTLFKFSPFVIGVCLLAYLLGDYINDLLFEYLKCKTKLHLGFRAIITSFVGHLLDSSIAFSSLSFVLWGYTYKDIPDLLIKTILVGSLLRICVEILFLPVTIIVSKKLSEKRKCRE